MVGWGELLAGGHLLAWSYWRASNDTACLLTIWRIVTRRLVISPSVVCCVAFLFFSRKVKEVQHELDSVHGGQVFVWLWNVLCLRIFICHHEENTPSSESSNSLGWFSVLSLKNASKIIHSKGYYLQEEEGEFCHKNFVTAKGGKRAE